MHSLEYLRTLLRNKPRPTKSHRPYLRTRAVSPCHFLQSALEAVMMSHRWATVYEGISNYLHQGTNMEASIRIIRICRPSAERQRPRQNTKSYFGDREGRSMMTEEAAQPGHSDVCQFFCGVGSHAFPCHPPSVAYFDPSTIRCRIGPISIISRRSLLFFPRVLVDRGQPFVGNHARRH
jgi:hypothetical protein